MLAVVSSAVLSACVIKPSIDEQASTGVMSSQAPLRAFVFGETVEATNVDDLRYLVQSPLAERYAEARGITVSRAEAAAYVRQVDASRQADRPGTPPEPLSAEDAAARERIAAAFVQQWKINRALHERYGGRVAYQQGGAEPLDAWRRFLEDSQARGEFRLADPAQAAAFWEYFRNDSRHDFYPPGSPAEASALRTPPWETRR